MHLHQQSELQKKQQLLRQMQESQLLTIQRQQQMLLLQNLQKQQQRVSVLSSSGGHGFGISLDYCCRLVETMVSVPRMLSTTLTTILCC